MLYNAQEPGEILITDTSQAKILAQHPKSRCFPPHRLRTGAGTHTLSSPAEKVDGAAGLVSDHVIPVYKLWIVKKKGGSSQRCSPGGSKDLKEKNMGGPSQPLTVKYKKRSPTQRPPRANKHKPQARVKSFERLSFVRVSHSDDDPPYFALISGSPIPSFLKEPAPSPSLK